MLDSSIYCHVGVARVQLSFSKPEIDAFVLENNKKIGFVDEKNVCS